MYEVNLKELGTSKKALVQLEEEIRRAKRLNDRLFKVIVGKGSKNGSTHIIKNAVLAQLEEYKKKNFIKDYLDGSDYVFEEETCKAFSAYKLLDFASNDVGNGGIIIIFA